MYVIPTSNIFNPISLKLIQKMFFIIANTQNPSTLQLASFCRAHTSAKDGTSVRQIELQPLQTAMFCEAERSRFCSSELYKNPRKMGT